ncbi:MAG: outer membrane lipoprotein-sorting protein [Bacteroidota bacterium]
MKDLKFILLIGSLSLLTSLTQAQDAKEIIRKSNEKTRGKTSSGSMIMKIVRPKWTRTVSLKSWSKGDDYSLILIQAPAKDKGSSFLKRGREMWNWQPTINRTIKLPPSMMSQSWMGSDFTNDDLIKQSSIVDDYTHKVIGSEKMGDRECYKIQLIPKPDAPVVWGKVLMWISKKDYLQLKSEMYDEDGYLVNTMKGSNIKMVGGRLLPSQLEMIPADKQGQKTVLIYASMRFDQPISDDFFSTQNMKRVK